MTLSVPVRRSANSDAVLVFFDPARRVLEVLPTVARTDSTVTVMSTHFRADLLLGRPLPAIGPAATPRTSPTNVSSGWLFPVAHPVPMLPVPLSFSLDQFRWPVVDHGTASYPYGYGLEITSLQRMAVADGGLKFDGFKGLDTPGFYADAGPIAVLSEMAAHRPAVMSTLGSLAAVQFADKPTRDQLFQHNITAQLGLTGQPAMAAVYPDGTFGPPAHTAFVLGVASPQNTLTFASPASTVTSDFLLLTGGFGPISIRPSADAAAVSVNSVIPVTSFVMPFNQYGPSFASLLTLNGTSGAQREAINTALASKAGLSQPTFELRTDPLAADAVPVTYGASGVLRTPDAQLRFTPGSFQAGSPLFLYDKATARELARSTNGTLALAGLLPATVLPELTSREYVFSTASAPTGVFSFKQDYPVTLPVTRATFGASPDTAKIAGDTLRVTFKAPVKLPPNGGFRLRWDWGDGNFSLEAPGEETASHLYGAAGSFKVAATLYSGDLKARLAFDTVVVASEVVPYWRITTFADQDDLLSLAQSADLATLLHRIVDAPQAGLIAIEDESGGGTALRLRVLQTGTWSLTNCCPPSARLLPGEIQSFLGKMPEERFSVGSFFAGYDSNRWAQSTADLGSGTLTGQYLDGGLRSYSFADGSSQVGPRGVLRITATRNGTAMAGMITLTGWFVDSDTDEIDESGPGVFRLPFTAVRLK